MTTYNLTEAEIAEMSLDKCEKAIIYLRYVIARENELDKRIVYEAHLAQVEARASILQAIKPQTELEGTEMETDTQ